MASVTALVKCQRLTAGWWDGSREMEGTYLKDSRRSVANFMLDDVDGYSVGESRFDGSSLWF